jgi:glycosyltransferase involved in cell wall biosynthesis
MEIRLARPMVPKHARVLIISSCAHLNKGGQPISVLNTALHLAKRGIDVYMITAISPEHVAFKTLKKHGIKCYTIPISDNKMFSLVFGLFVLFKGIATIRKHDIKFVQVHAPSSALLSLPLKILFGVKVILITHGFWRNEKVGQVPKFIMNGLNKLLENIERFIYTRIDAFISPVNYDEYTPYLIKMGVDKQNVYETNFGPPVYKFKNKDDVFMEKLPGSKFSKKIVFIGKIAQHKGQEILIKATPKIIQERPEVGVIFVGDGPDMARCQALVKELKLTSNVIFTGSRSDSERFFEYADVAVYHIPANDTYGLGTSHREAVYLGVPLVTKEDPIAKKYFQDTIWYVNPYSIESVSDTILKVLDSRQEAEIKSQKAYNILLELFDWDKYVDTNLTIYSEIK